MSHDPNDVPAGFTTEARIHVGIPLRGDFDPHPDGSGGLEIDSDWYRVWLEAGRTYILEFPTTRPDAWIARFISKGPKLDTFFEGVGENGGLATIVTSNVTLDYFVETRHSFVPTEAPYTVSVSIYDIPDNRNTLHEVKIDEPQTSFVDFESDRDFFAVDLTEGWTYQFDLKSNGFDGDLNPVARLFDQDVNLLQVDHDSGEGNNAQLTYLAGYTGRYYFSAAGFQTSTGGYQLAASVVDYIDDYAMGVETEGRINLKPNQPTVFTGRMEVPDDIDWLKVDLVAGKWYFFGTTSIYGRPAIFLRDTDNEVTTPVRSKSWRFHYQAKKTGTHHLVIKDGPPAQDYTAWAFDNYAPEIAAKWPQWRGQANFYSLFDLVDFPASSVQVYSEAPFSVGTEQFAANQTHVINEVDLARIQFNAAISDYRVNVRAIGGGTASGWVQSTMIPNPVPTEQLARGSVWDPTNTQRQNEHNLTFRFADAVPSYFEAGRFTGFAPVSTDVEELFRSLFLGLPISINFEEDPTEQADIQIFTADSDSLAVGYAPGLYGFGDIVLDNEFFSGNANPIRGTEEHFAILKAVATSLGIKHFSTELNREQSLVGLANDATVLSHPYPSTFGDVDIAFLRNEYGYKSFGGFGASLGYGDLPFVHTIISNGLYPSIVAEDSPRPVSIDMRDGAESYLLGEGNWQSLINGRDARIQRGLGSDFDDLIAGNHTSNTLIGMPGDDVLVGRGGNDRLHGGLGDDTYVYTVGDGDDRILDHRPDYGGEDTLKIFIRFAQTDLTDDLRFFRKGDDLQIDLDLNGQDNRTSGTIVVEDFVRSPVEKLDLSVFGGESRGVYSMVSIWDQLTNERTRFAPTSASDSHGIIVSPVG